MATTILDTVSHALIYDSEGTLVRRADLMNSAETDSIVESQQFLYTFQEKERSLFYELPGEELNNITELEKCSELLKEKDEAYQRVLLDRVFLPQVEAGVATRNFVFTGTSNSDDQSFIYLPLLVGEQSVSIISRSSSSVITSVSIGSQLVAYNKGLVIYLEVSGDLNYGENIYDAIPRPCKWFVDSGSHRKDRPMSTSAIRTTIKDKVRLSNDKLIILNSVVGSADGTLELSTSAVIDDMEESPNVPSTNSISTNKIGRSFFGITKSDVVKYSPFREYLLDEICYYNNSQYKSTLADNKGNNPLSGEGWKQI